MYIISPQYSYTNPGNVISNVAQRSEKSKILALKLGPLETQRSKGRTYQSSCVMIPNKTLRFLTAFGITMAL